MKRLNIIQLNREDFGKKNPFLNSPSNEVNDFGKDFQEIVDSLIETMKSHKIAIGLSAPQVGIPLKLSVINLNENKAEPTLVIVNPKIVSTSGKKDKKK